MAADFNNVIKVFSKFLDVEQVNFDKIKSIEDILKLPIYSYRFINEEEAKILEEVFGIYNVDDASKLNMLEPTELISKAKERGVDLYNKMPLIREKFPEMEKKLKKAAKISALVKEIKTEELEFEKKQQKVVVVGLDNAGKTAMLNKFGGSLGMDDLVKLKPTRGVNRKIIESSSLDLIVFDMGGQQEYRDRYLNKPENYFLQIDLLIYVIDVQNPDRFEESFKYFEGILDFLITFEENPHILIYIHKVDPELKNDPEILLNIELLKDMINELFQKKNYEFVYETYLSSIYSVVSHEPQFSKFLKEATRANYSLTDPTMRKMEGMAKTLEDTMNAVIRLTESISTQLDNMDSRLNAIEIERCSTEKGIPIEIQDRDQIKEPKEHNIRANVLDELRDLFAKKKKLDL